MNVDNIGQREASDRWSFRPSGSSSVMGAICQPPRFETGTQIVEFHVPTHVSTSLTKEAIDLASRLATDIERNADLMGRAGAALLTNHLPRDELRALVALSVPSTTTAVILRRLAELPADDTPTGGFVAASALAAPDILLAGALHIAGTEPVAFPYENRGLIARNVVANPEHRGAASSHGFDVELFWHQDNCGQPFDGEILEGCTLPPMPLQLGFYAIRNDEFVPTRLLPLDTPLASLSERTLLELTCGDYRIGAPASVAADGFGGEAVDDAPILRFSNGFWEGRYDPFLVTPKTPKAAAANVELILALVQAESHAIGVTLGGGDLMIFKNYRLLHMRVAFSPLQPARSRWLRRFYGGARKGPLAACRV